MFLFTAGHGMATLLLVILVPGLLPPPLVPLGLGLHKSMEMASSSLSQTLAGLWLDWTDDAAVSERMEQEAYEAGEGLLRIFWFINILQLGCIFLLWRFEARRRQFREDGLVIQAEEYEQLPMSAVSYDTPSETLYDDDQSDEGREDEDDIKRQAVEPDGLAGSAAALALDDRERRRGKWAFRASLGFIAIVWVVFLVSAWSRL